jgi:outer membrane protein assembly complex protein YaeT
MADLPALERTIEDALFEEDALARGRDRLLEALRARGHLEAEVETRSEPGPDRRTLVFRAAPGPLLRVASVSFPGATALSLGRLLEAAGGPARLLSEPDAARRGIREAYRERHYLAAEAGPPRVTRSGDELRVTVPIEEGPRAGVRSLRFVGIEREGDELVRAAGIAAGAPFEQERVLAAVDRIREHYYGLGYPGVRVAPRVEAAGNDLDVVFEVGEGTRQTIGAIEIEGARATRESFVRGTLGFAVGDPLDPRLLAAAERRLLALGAFARASVTRAGAEEGDTPVRVELQEEARLSAGYQARYNDDKGMSGDLDAEVGNLFGRAVALGARYSLGRDDEEIRGSILLPSVRFLGDLTGSVFRDSEERPLDEDDDTLPTLQQLEKGFELQASRQLPSRWRLLYGYRFKTSSVSSELDEFGVTTKIASLDGSLLRDTRDSPLDARRGRFWSLNLELAPRQLGSDLDFVKGMAQLFASRSFGRSSWGGALTWAQGYRLGLAHVFSDERLLFSERFKAGGSHSIRGFATDSVGPRDFFGDPAGGEALFVMNQELRYMLPAGLGGVVFWDAGNVFAKASDLSLDLRHSLGAGLRWASPVGLLRLDLGFPLDPQPDEKAYRIHFSLGQAF